MEETNLRQRKLSPMEWDIIETFRKADELHQTMVLASLGIESKWQKKRLKSKFSIVKEV